jgi:hypothetical protein
MPLRRRQASDVPIDASPPPTPAVRRDADQRPSPQPGSRNLVIVVLDSLRYDSLVAARPRHIARLGEITRRWSYASWTAPSHYNLLMGLLPHDSPTHVYASEYYKRDFAKYTERLGVDGLDFSSLLPSLFVPTFLKSKLGYRTHAMVSMPVLNPATAINRDFDSFELMPRHNDMAAMLDRMTFSDERPSFYMLNVGETHYPYALPDEDSANWPRISGVHGVVKHMNAGEEDSDGAFFDQAQLAELRDRQVRAASYVDDVIGRLFDLVPANTWIVVTSDHGELFGEDGYFGHGPIMHEKVLEVPFVEGLRP